MPSRKSYGALVPGNFERILEALGRENVEYVVIGGLAAVTHGSPYLTDDLDISYGRAPSNVEALVRALAPLNPRLRVRGGEVPMVWDGRTVTNGLNFTLSTDAGDLDLLGDVQGIGTYEAMLPECETVELYGQKVRILSIRQLIAAKRAAGRPKDLLHIDALEEILRSRRG